MRLVGPVYTGAILSGLAVWPRRTKCARQLLSVLCQVRRACPVAPNLCRSNADAGLSRFQNCHAATQGGLRHRTRMSLLMRPQAPDAQAVTFRTLYRDQSVPCCFAVTPIVLLKVSRSSHEGTGGSPLLPGGKKQGSCQNGNSNLQLKINRGVHGQCAKSTIT
jgi:hypothetical protein